MFGRFVAVTIRQSPAGFNLRFQFPCCGRCLQSCGRHVQDRGHSGPPFSFRRFPRPACGSPWRPCRGWALRAFGDPGCHFQQRRRRRAFGDKIKRSIVVDRDDDRNRSTVKFLGAVVKLLNELPEVDPVLTQATYRPAEPELPVRQEPEILLDLLLVLPLFLYSRFAAVTTDNRNLVTLLRRANDRVPPDWGDQKY